ncbi:hypothetical protein RRG08_056280 [Elysia crispata]|uniref:Uncharacterized protein n=1 Tax=Elysia crispata TaxID=231223 RepID=A0AAE1AWE2_9GAST|nr:hypothetical protein RRG08_056280 [Elysia crispata]
MEARHRLGGSALMLLVDPEYTQIVISKTKERPDNFPHTWRSSENLVWTARATRLVCLPTAILESLVPRRNVGWIA